MSMCNRYIITLLLIPLAIWCSGQPLNLRFDHITSEHGLPQNTIHGIVKDKYGFMWFGTWSGLCRYDGYRFKIYRYDPENSKSINNNRIHNILKDAAQDLWVMTFDEQTLCKYNYDTDDFERIPLEKVPVDLQKLISRKNYHMSTSFRFGNHEWRLERRTNTLVETNLTTGKDKHYAANPGIRGSLNDSYVSDVYLDNQDILWIGTYSNGINKANLHANPFHNHYHIPTDERSIIDDNVRTLCEDTEGNLWVGTRDQGITIVGKDGSYRHLQHDATDSRSLKSNQIRYIYCDSGGNLWIGTKEGLDRYDPKTGKIRHFDMLDPQYTPIYGITEDHDEQLWFATWGGIYRYVPDVDSMTHFDPSDMLLNEHAWVILEDRQGKLWVGTEGGGISVINKDTPGKLTLERHFIHKQDSVNSISDNRVYALYEDSDGYIWIGTGNGLNRFNPTNQTFQHLSVSPNGLPNAMIAGITEDDNGFLWVSHKAGISRVDKQSFAIRNYSQQDGLQSNEFLEGAVLKSRHSRNLYFGGNKGYNTFNPDSITCDQRPPQIAFTDLQILNKHVHVAREVNGRVLLKKPLHLTDRLALTYRDKSIAIEFAALHYTNPARNRYAYMLEGFDEDWIYTDAAHRVATYSNLSPGDYVFKVKASNSDGIWSPEPKTLAISVAPAFWASTWAYALYSLVFIGLLYAFYYYVVRYAKLSSKLAYETILHEQERQHHESKVQFFTNISHEIKTPLTLILAPIQQLMGLSGTNGAMKNQLRTMKANGDRLFKLINQLLDIRRFETGNERLSPERRDVIGLVHEIADSFQHMAHLGNITLTTRAETAPVYNHFDPDKLEKVLYNLLSNAFKFTGDGGHIDVNVYTEETPTQSVVIEVADNGLGISTEDLPRIFDLFRQGKSNKVGGTGLGLAYAKSLVELHGGTITVQSEGKHIGENRTVFSVRIPLRVDDTAVPSQPKAAMAAWTKAITTNEESAADDAQAGVAPPPSRPYTLLLVEDNREMRKYLGDFFSNQYHVIEAATGVEGLAAAVKHTPDLIVSDVMMPEMDGFALCRKLKADILTSHIPVVLLTARTLIEYEIEGIKTGADDYVIKPFNLTLLSLKMANLLNIRIQLREKFKREVTIEPSKLNAVSPDEQLLKRMMTYIEDQLAEPGLSVDDICDEIGLSRTQLYRKMKALTGFSIGDIIKEIRLKRAQQLLRDKHFNVNEIAYMTGFSDPDYFRKCFKAKLGISPSEYSKRSAQETSTAR